MNVLLALALSLGMQDARLVQDIDEIIESMRASLDARVAGYKELVKLRFDKPGVVQILRQRIEKEPDARIRVRLRLAIGSAMCDRYWFQKLSPLNNKAMATATHLYYQKPDGTAAARLLATGEETWTGATSAPWGRAPKVTKDDLWIQTNDDKTAFIYQLPLNGAIRPPRSTILPDKFWLDGNYAGFRSARKFRCQEIENPDKGWEAKCADKTQTLMAAGCVVVFDGEGALLGLDPANGKTLWNGIFDWSVNFFETKSDILIIRSARPRLRAIEAATGKVLWSEDLNKATAEGTVPIVLTDRFLLQTGMTTVCRELKSGRVEWSLAIPPLAPNGAKAWAVVGTTLVWIEPGEKQFLHAIDLATGGSIGKQQMYGEAIHTIIPSESGMWVCLHQDGSVDAWKLRAAD